MQSLNLLNQITLSLTRITEFDELVYQSIQQGINHLGFTRLSIWLLNDDNNLVGKSRVNADGIIIDNSDEIIHVTPNNNSYDPLFLSKTSLTQRNIDLLDPQMNKIGRGDRAFIPMLDGDVVVGCLYSDTLLDNAPFTDEAIEILNLYGATLGVLFNRQRSREELQQREAQARHFQKLLKHLNEINISLSAIDSLIELTREAVILAREKLEFDRVGIWLTDDTDPNLRVGMWGTDQYGNVRDERYIVTPIPPKENAMVSEGDVVVIHDNDICEPDGTFITKGWTLIGLMWDGTKRIGWLYADNGITNKTFTQDQLDIFRLFTAQLGLLCAEQIAEDKLRQSEIRFRAITESSSDVVVIIDEKANMSYVSPSVKYVMDVEPDRLVKQAVRDMIHPDDLPLAETVLKQCFETRDLRTRVDNIRIRHISGFWVHMEAVVTSLLDNPAVKGIVVNCRDITERLIAVERKRLAEQERERSWLLRQFISDVSHDFRTPLSTINTYAYLLKNNASEQTNTRVDIIQEQIVRLTKLIHNMNTIAKLDETSDLAMISTYVNSLIETALGNTQLKFEQKQLTVKHTLATDLPPIRGNPSLLHDAFVHVLDNAIQHCTEGDTIQITSTYTKNGVTVGIRDTGAGIAESDLPYIFDSLYRVDKSRNTNEGGGGLGLAITRRVVELHNGTIHVESIEGEGTTIALIFPTSQVISTTN